MEVHLRQIHGNWDAGWVLDKHVRSRSLVGHDASNQPLCETVRSEVGTAHFQLKYEGRFDRIEPLANELAIHIAPQFSDIEAIIPMPPSKERARQPVTEIARALSKIIDVPMLDGILEKLPPVPGREPEQESDGKAARLAALDERMCLHRNIPGERRWNVLLLDDIYETGAQMEAATAKLREYEKIGKIYATALTWK
jgi:predicted amidophosphoribosyltransferase